MRTKTTSEAAISLTAAGSVCGNLSSRARHTLGSGGVDNLGRTQDESDESAETSEGHWMYCSVVDDRRDGPRILETEDHWSTPFILCLSCSESRQPTVVSGTLPSKKQS